MAFTDVARTADLAALHWLLQQRRPPERVRAQVNLAGAGVGHTADLFEVRPQRNDPGVTRHTPVARTRSVGSAHGWRLCCQQADLKRHGSKPRPTRATLHDALAVVDEDASRCCFG